MLRTLRNDQFAILWTIVRIYLGWKWISAGWGKITGDFDASRFVGGAIAKATGDHPAVQSWYASFLEGFVLPNVGLFNFLIPWGEFLVGVGLILGLFTTASLIAGAFMNFNFMMSGTVSTNPILYTLAVILLFMLPATNRYGLDYYFFHKRREKK